MGESASPEPHYRFGPYRIDARERLLRRGSEVVPLTPKAVDTLLALVEARGRLVAKEELMSRLWPDTFVEDANLSNQISLLRKALGEDGAGTPYIQTVARRGYRFTAAVGDAADADARRPRAYVLISSIVVALVAILVVLWRATADDGAALPPPLKVSRLTASGQARHASISGDARYVAYTVQGKDGEGLRLRTVGSTTDVELVPSRQATYLGLTFSPDGASIYYVVREPARAREGVLYEVAAPPAVSEPRVVLRNIDTPVAFSHDGQRISYIASSEMTGRSALMVANADGTGAYPLAVRTAPNSFSWVGAGPAWAPNGNSIVCAGVTTDGAAQYSTIVEVQLADGSQRPLGSRRWTQVGRIAWLADASSFFVAASERLDANQLWRVSYPSGDAQPITNNQSANYVGATVTADGSTLAAVQRDRQSSLWLADGIGASRAQRITQGNYDGRFGLAWAPDRRIVYHSLESGNDDIWIVNHDGSGRRQLTVDPGADDRPSVSPDGRHVVFTSNRSGDSQIWRMDIDGGNQRQLTRGPGNINAVVTPDGRWVVYSSTDTGGPKLWKAPLATGEAVQLSSLNALDPAVSPDGALVAFHYFDNPEADAKLAVIRLSDGKLVEVFDSPAIRAAREFRWTSHGITAIATADGVSNIWTVPMDGRPARQLTRFDAHRIVRHDWSPDGQQLIYARGTLNDDVVLIGDLPRER